MIYIQILLCNTLYHMRLTIVVCKLFSCVWLQTEFYPPHTNTHIDRKILFKITIPLPSHPWLHKCI